MTNVVNPLPGAAHTSLDGEATAAEVEAALLAARMDAVAAALPPELRAAVVRAAAVQNAMATYRNTLLREDPPEWRQIDRDRAAELRATAVARINAAWRALAGRTVRTEERRRVLEAIDEVARMTDTGVAAGRAMLALLPPELHVLLSPRTEAVGQVVETWRQRTPGRRPGDAPGKWDACVALWQQATGEATTASAWEKTWKDRQRARAARARRRIGPHPPTKKRGATYSPK